MLDRITLATTICEWYKGKIRRLADKVIFVDEVGGVHEYATTAILLREFLPEGKLYNIREPRKYPWTRSEIDFVESL